MDDTDLDIRMLLSLITALRQGTARIVSKQGIVLGQEGIELTIRVEGRPAPDFATHYRIR